MNLWPRQNRINLSPPPTVDPPPPPPGPAPVRPAPPIRHEVVVRVEHDRCEVVDELLTVRAELEDARREVVRLGQEATAKDEEIARLRTRLSELEADPTSAWM